MDQLGVAIAAAAFGAVLGLIVRFARKGTDPFSRAFVGTFGAVAACLVLLVVALLFLIIIVASAR